MNIHEIVKKLNEASDAYYNGDEIMTDKEYDELYSKLEEHEYRCGAVDKNSPTQKVGYQVKSSLVKVKHEYPSLSLSKTKNKDEMRTWLGDDEAVLSWKCDGLTVVLTYNKGRLVKAATRGDGKIGEDITANAKFFKGIPEVISDNRYIVIRGEAIITDGQFEKVNELMPMDKKYKHPRSMASGAVRYFDPNKSAMFGVEFMGFELVNASELGFVRMSDGLMFLLHNNINVVEWCLTDKTNIIETISNKEKSIKRLGFPSDGLVVTYNNLIRQKELGCTAKYPRYSKAFKWADTMKMTTLLDVEWSVSNTGLISPIAVFEPVEIEGTRIRRASLHNTSRIRELQLGIGDHIRVYKANMIIPQVHDSVEKRNNVLIPKICPVCKSEVKSRTGVNKKTQFIHCTNSKCSSRGENNEN